MLTAGTEEPQTQSRTEMSCWNTCLILSKVSGLNLPARYSWSYIDYCVHIGDKSMQISDGCPLRHFLVVDVAAHFKWQFFRLFEERRTAWNSAVKCLSLRHYFCLLSLCLISCLYPNYCEIKTSSEPVTRSIWGPKASSTNSNTTVRLE